MSDDYRTGQQLYETLQEKPLTPEQYPVSVRFQALKRALAAGNESVARKFYDDERLFMTLTTQQEETLRAAAYRGEVSSFIKLYYEQGDTSLHDKRLSMGRNMNTLIVYLFGLPPHGGTGNAERHFPSRDDLDLCSIYRTLTPLLQRNEVAEAFKRLLRKSVDAEVVQTVLKQLKKQDMADALQDQQLLFEAVDNDHEEPVVNRLYQIGLTLDREALTIERWKTLVVDQPPTFVELVLRREDLDVSDWTNLLAAGLEAEAPVRRLIIGQHTPPMEAFERLGAFDAVSASRIHDEYGSFIDDELNARTTRALRTRGIIE